MTTERGKEMGMYEQADKEVELLEEQLEEGVITEEEFRRYTREIAEDVRDMERRGVG